MWENLNVCLKISFIYNFVLWFSYTVHVPIVKGSCDVNYWCRVPDNCDNFICNCDEKEIVKQMFRIKVILLHCLFVAELEK